MSLDNFKSNEHALQAGMLAGHFMKHGIEFSIELDDDDDYTPRITIDMGYDFEDVTIEVLPPVGEK